MSPRTQKTRARRDRERDLALLRAAVARQGTIFGTDSWVRRLVAAGYAVRPSYSYGAARDAHATITEAGRAHVEASGVGS